MITPKSHLVVGVVFAVLFGLLALGRRALGSSVGAGVHECHAVLLTAFLASAVARSDGTHEVHSTVLTAGGIRWCSGRARGACARGTRARGARSSSHPTTTRPASCPRRIAPSLAAGDRRPAVRLVGVEILRWRRGGVVALGIIRTVDVRRQWRVMVRVGFLVVRPLLMLGRLGPVEVAGERGLREPVVCVGGLDEALGGGEMLVWEGC